MNHLKCIKFFIVINILVTSPLGKKSNPTIDSNKELFPLLYVPRTTILGSIICLSRPISLILSIILINLLRLSSNDILFKIFIKH